MLRKDKLKPEIKSESACTDSDSVVFFRESRFDIKHITDSCLDAFEADEPKRRTLNDTTNNYTDTSDDT